MGKKLKGLRVAVLAADGFEQVELTQPVQKLRQEGACVKIISLLPHSIRGMNHLVPGKKVAVDAPLKKVKAADFDALVLPGGLANPDTLRQSELAREFVTDFERLGRPVAVICHGPWLLISAGLVRGRRLTSWPGIQDDVRNAGGLWEDAAVVRDGTWVSSRGPQDLPAFDQAMTALFAEYLPQPKPRRIFTRTRRWPRWLLGGLALAALGYGLRERQSLAV
ncbi:type 1 glutamine amidotransferase domain-containing protein [Stigmatella aurantiaca]|uniref:Peptidase, C56 (PfpI) family n=1 Tax=Stigmatella aurantiaca (strain DW4/3-1) TaxID=378806 RepID=Q09CC9_STIAD|nr:type 1 glutamine amidotransferase domain-containing protein [Stigmatella aurantiaca]ADO69580.1 Peptidase, C56 (PfpI) family [Stigmatella aurantiaca DW4/3-1]EAU69441.1 protease [Stigmatella aurantiaca DW4/3-1]